MATATPTALDSIEVKSVIAQAKADALANPPRTVSAAGTQVQTPYPSPEDWRDRWIYFLLVDRFNNPIAAPAAPDPFLPYQGGTFEGIRQQIPRGKVATSNASKRSAAA